MILVTGAGGKTGRAVIRALVARRAAVYAFVRRAEQADALTRLGAAHVIVGDMEDAAALAAAARGAEAIYHIAPNVSPHEVAFGEAAIAAGTAAGVGRFVFHSVLKPQLAAMPHHWAKLLVEELLAQSEFDVTVLQPAPYMQNLLPALPSIRETGVYRVPYAVEARLSLVELDDVAEVAAKVLLEPGHAAATYELAGTERLSQVEVADILGAALGRPVRAEAEPPEAWERRARAAGIGDPEREKLLAMFRYYDRHGLAGNSNVLRFLLGRPPTSLEACIISMEKQT
jgi:NAD(P)H dehydrogenase (quinone)